MTINTDYVAITVKAVHQGKEVIPSEDYNRGWSILRKHAVPCYFQSVARINLERYADLDSITIYCDGEQVLNMSRGN